MESKQYLSLCGSHKSQGVNSKINEFSKSIGKDQSYVVRAFDFKTI